jgi:hypothetical protein
MKLNWEEDGVSQRSRLEQVWTQTGKKPSELELEALPVELVYLREVFWDIWDSEGWSWTEFYHYQVIFEMEFDLDEIYILRKAFVSCLRFIQQKSREKMKKSSKAAPKKGK